MKIIASRSTINGLESIIRGTCRDVDRCCHLGGCLSCLTDEDELSVVEIDPGELRQVLVECISLFALGAGTIYKKSKNFEEKRAKARSIEQKVAELLKKLDGQAK